MATSANSTPASRRNFLRGLAALPLIGGGVTLIGEPTAAAVPVTDALQERYLGWLALEHRAAVREHAYRAALAHHGRHLVGDGEAWARSQGERASYLAWVPNDTGLTAMVGSADPSTRAAVILSAAGVSLSGGAL